LPNYLFRCDQCGELSRERLAVEDRHNAPDCPNCQLIMQRQYSIPQLITQPEHLREENNPYPGKSATEVRAIERQEAADYEKIDYSHLPKKRTPEQIFAESKPMREIATELGLKAS
jgi:putative FmdB family regulatory protein